MPDLRRSDGSRIHFDVFDMTDPWLEQETVFLHHGLGKSGRFWRPWVRLLARDYRVITIDMLGNGRSSRPRGRTWGVEGYADNVVEVLDSLQVETVHFVGETLGGCVGLVMGARHGTRIRSLALASCPYRPPREHLLERGRAVTRGGLEASVDSELPSRLDWSLYPAAMYTWYRDQRLSASSRIVSEQRQAQANEDLEWTLPLISAPTLLYIPDESLVGANAQMREMARVIPNAVVADLPPGRRPVWYHYGFADTCVAVFLDFQRRIRQTA